MTSTWSQMQSAPFRAELRIAPLRSDDLPAVSSLHSRAFPESAITAFGPEVVRRYYQWLLEGPHDAALIGAWAHEKIVGFCAAGVYRGAMNGFLRANRVYLLAHMATHPLLLLSPLIRERVRRAIHITARFSRLSRRVTSAAGGAGNAPQFGVLSIATAPDVRGHGAGRALMLDAEQRARAGGHARMVLTVHPDNHRAISFYEQLGWDRRIDPETTAWSGGMYKDLLPGPD